MLAPSGAGDRGATWWCEWRSGCTGGLGSKGCGDVQAVPLHVAHSDGQQQGQGQIPVHSLNITDMTDTGDETFKEKKFELMIFS